MVKIVIVAKYLHLGIKSQRKRRSGKRVVEIKQYEIFLPNLPDGGMGCCVTLRIDPAFANLACWLIPILACIICAWAAALYSGGGGLPLPIPPAICCCCCITCKSDNKNWSHNNVTIDIMINIMRRSRMR